MKNWLIFLILSLHAASLHAAEAFVFYEVQKQDEIAELSMALGACKIWGTLGSVKEIVELNPQLKPRPKNKLVPGEIIKIPIRLVSPVSNYFVKDGQKYLRRPFVPIQDQCFYEDIVVQKDVISYSKRWDLQIKPSFEFISMDGTQIENLSKARVSSEKGYGFRLGFANIPSTNSYRLGGYAKYNKMTLQEPTDFPLLNKEVATIESRFYYHRNFWSWLILGLDFTYNQISSYDRNTENQIAIETKPKLGAGLITGFYITEKFSAKYTQAIWSQKPDSFELQKRLNLPDESTTSLEIENCKERYCLSLETKYRRTRFKNESLSVLQQRASLEIGYSRKIN